MSTGNQADTLSPPWARAAATLAAIAITALLLFGHLGHFPLMKPDEVRNAEVGREMMESGNWIVPTFNGLAYLDKPAFFFKCVGLGFAGLGVSEGVARLPSVVSGAALLLAAYLFCQRVHRRREALLAVLVTVTMPMFVVFSRLVIMDMMFTLFLSLAIFAGFLAEEREGWARIRWHLAGVFAAGLATLVKGPLGFLLPWLVLAIFFLLDRRPRAILRLLAPWNIALLLAVVLPWFILLSQAHPDFPHYGIMRETFARFTSGDAFRRHKPFYFYGPLILGTFFVWSVMLPEACAAAWRARARLTRADRLCLVWAVVVVVFFSLPESKQPGYILSACVPVGMLVARLFGAAIDYGAGHAARLVRRAAAIALGIALLFWACLLVAGLRPATVLNLMQYGGDRTLNEVRLQLMGPFLPVLAMTFFLFAMLTAWARQRRSSLLIFAAFASFLPLTGLLNVRILEVYAKSRSQQLVAESVPALPPDTQVACVECFPIYLPFYLRRSITLVTEKGKEFPSNYIPYALEHTEPWPPQVVPRKEFTTWLQARQGPLYLIANKRARVILEGLAAEAGMELRDLSHGYVGLLLQPQKEF